MISYRTADLLQHFKSKSHEIVFVFYVAKYQQWMSSCLDVYQSQPHIPVLSKYITAGSKISITYLDGKFDARNLDFSSRTYNLNDITKQNAAGVADNFMDKLRADGYDVKVTEDHIYSKDEGSNYIIFFKASKK